VVFKSGFIVGLSGVDFGVEPAEPYSFFMMHDSGDPAVRAFFQKDADVSGGGFLSCLGFVELVL